MYWKRHIDPLGEHRYAVVLKVGLSNEANDLSVSVTARASFEFVSNDYSNEDFIINNNTIALMIPLIRGQISLLTAQPGMKPILLPAINTTRLKFEDIESE